MPSGGPGPGARSRLRAPLPPDRKTLGSARPRTATLTSMMSRDDLLSVLALLRDAGTDVVLGGGWGIDALLGEQTREHRDADLLHDREQEPALIAALTAAGYTETLDRRPARFVYSHPSGLEIDLHPLAYAPDGSAVQSSLDPAEPYRYPAECFVTGTVGGTEVRCLSAEQQVLFHQGYEPADRDRQDMERLRLRFGVEAHI
ncbi:nucleotidyltransferase family protein [Streptomyces sp. NBC_00654]|uniref:nucleotidyltransferase domain-containing protein n=1 Tax=Streptomyces sp. NBC_00654 TaxID=2975799 RepID=UPI00224E2D0F|nr:nucleotidyltransferase family protein [Streptomyces sp. NBC_00654]MCX4965169.1 nucleotidyltransferase family protein [Streptomyces sp. NBC_00654]